MRFLILTIILFPLVSSAQGSEMVQVGEKEISYTKASEHDNSTLYYRGEILVASTHDRDSDGVVDVWLEYSNDEVVYEAHDTDEDGIPDTFLKLRDDEVQNIEGTPEAWQEVESVDYTELIEGDGSKAPVPDDLVGSLDSITIPGGGGFPWLLVVVLLAAGGGYWFYRKKQEKSE